MRFLLFDRKALIVNVDVVATDVCKGPSIACAFNSNFLPDELDGIMTMAEYSNMITEVLI